MKWLYAASNALILKVIAEAQQNGDQNGNNHIYFFIYVGILSDIWSEFKFYANFIYEFHLQLKCIPLIVGNISNIECLLTLFLPVSRLLSPYTWYTG